MKTRKYIPTLLIATAMLLATSIFASERNFDFEDEGYINDIPFNTEQIVIDIKLRNIDFDEEAYVDDIPFKTDRVVKMYNYTNAVNTDYTFEEEANINDIPFNTKSVAAMHNYKKALQVIFDFADESPVDDIEVNTAVNACISEYAWSCNLSCSIDLTNN